MIMSYTKPLITACAFLLALNVRATDKKEKKEVLTLSGGKYVEVFDQDSIEQIGSILYNVNSEKIVGFVEPESKESTKVLKPEIMSRWLSVDPLARKFPSESPYCFAGNNPIYYVDKDGLYKVSAENERNYNQNYPLIMKYLSTQVEHDVANSSKIVNGLVSINPNIQPSTVKGVAKWGSGPEIVFKDAPGEFPMEFKGAAGYTEKSSHTIQLNAGYAKYLEGVLAGDASAEVKQAAFTRFYMTLIHETGHELNKYGAVAGQNEQGNYLYSPAPGGTNSSDEVGYKAEEYIWGTGDYMPFSRPALNQEGGVMGIGSEKYQPGVTEGVIKEANKTPEGRSSLPTVPQP